MPNSTTNPPIEIGIPPWTVATTGPAASGQVTQWYYHCSRVFSSGSCVASGVNVVAGTTTGAVVRVFLLDLGGNILASNAVAGTTLSTASVANAVPFSTPYAIVGPQAYFIAVQANAGTNNILSFVTQVAAPAGFIGNTSADVPSSLATPTSGVITPPTAYVSAKAPVVSLY